MKSIPQDTQLSATLLQTLLERLLPSGWALPLQVVANGYPRFLWGMLKSFPKIRLWRCLHNPVNMLKTTQLTLEMGECYGV